VHRRLGKRCFNFATFLPLILRTHSILRDDGPDTPWGPWRTFNLIAIVNLYYFLISVFRKLFSQIMTISILSAMLLLVSSSLLLNEVTHLANYTSPLGKVDLCMALRHAGKQTCGHLQIAAVRSVLCVLNFFSRS